MYCVRTISDIRIKTDKKKTHKPLVSKILGRGNLQQCGKWIGEKYFSLLQLYKQARQVFATMMTQRA
jgi:hypothetical protein